MVTGSGIDDGSSPAGSEAADRAHSNGINSSIKVLNILNRRKTSFLQNQYRGFYLRFSLRDVLKGYGLELFTYRSGYAKAERCPAAENLLHIQLFHAALLHQQFAVHHHIADI